MPQFRAYSWLAKHWIRKNRERKVELDRIAAMLSCLGGRGYCVKEDTEPYGKAEFDPDSDFDPDETKVQQKPGADGK